MLRPFIQQLFNQPPEATLYHYTTLSGLLGIVRSEVLWASDVRYMNDSAELHHMLDLLTEGIQSRIISGDPKAQLLNHFAQWINERLNQGHMLFAASFRANGNLLSQWRGYSSIGKGVSLGFHPDHISHWAKEQQFEIGRCIYDTHTQTQLVQQAIDSVCQIDLPEDELFAEVETDLLRLAVLLKHPSFREEDEWRVVLPITHQELDPRVKFREGSAMLKPYTEFALSSRDQPMALEHVYLGPSPDSTLSINSLRLFFRQHKLMPIRGIEDSKIPFRAC
ncbi:DUF2971 domain-containing protein [Celerinatantimonas diazotrophica]|uniref:DUF2971 family protein n=1 Tax=Celerinatantimonas diazotrophica TaxID=412034 RepID=A0A4R1J9A6_9GAMM|nr:DUF2971 domain-containing protein [Celerinatantimonas diazotrophica]TCK46679.1 DUF2971 family protein [Celerinatantimonas diazotrophica]CAG9295381.1 hypothetical protein CEDIAZO_00497 [Celerinatantimonas diazotrophica]